MRPKLGEWLVTEQLITAAQLEACLQAQLMYGGRFGTNLVELGLMQDNALAAALSRFAGVPEATREQLDLAQEAVVRSFKPEWAKKFGAFPFRQDEQRRVHVAVLDPYEPAVIDGLSFTLGARVVPYVVTELRLWHSLSRWYGLKREVRYLRLQPDEQELRALGLTPAEGAAHAVATRTPTLVRERLALFGTFDDRAAVEASEGKTPPLGNDLRALGAPLASKQPTPAPVTGTTPAPPKKPTLPPGVLTKKPTLPAGVMESPRKQTLPPGALFVSSSPSGIVSALEGKPVPPPSALAETALTVARQVVPRAMIFVECFGHAVFWRGEGEGSDSPALRALRLDLARPSLFSRAAYDRTAQTVLMPPGEDDQELFAALGGPHEYAMAFPVMRRGAAVFFLYIDCGRASVPTSVITTLTRMTASMSAALGAVA